MLLFALGVLFFFSIGNPWFFEDEFSGEFSYKEKKFDSKDGILSSLKKVDDGYLAFFDTNIISDDVYTADVKITKYDLNFKEEWNYNYNRQDELKKINIHDEDYNTYISDIREKNGLYYIIANLGNIEGKSNSSLLIFNKNGTLYKNKVFKNSFFDKIIDISNEVISLSESNFYYEYNINTEKLLTMKIEKNNKNKIELIDKENSLYHAYSYINDYYSDEKFVVEGDNSFYLLNDKLKIIKKTNLDKILKVKINNHRDIVYGDVKKIGDKFYLTYYTTFAMFDEADTNYNGLLILDNDLNKIRNIKYDDFRIKNKIESIFDYYDYNKTLYVLSELKDDYIMIEKYDNNYKRISYDIIELPGFDKFEDNYSMSEKKLLGFDNNGFSFYQIFDNQDYDNPISYLRIYYVKY